MAMRAGMVFLFVFAAALNAAIPPVKLALQIDQRSLLPGQPTQMTLQLLDSQNHSVPAPKALHIVLNARLPSNKVVDLGTVDFAAGDTTKRISKTMPATGLLYLWAKNPELLLAGQFVNVRTQPAGVLVPNIKRRVAPPQPEITLRYSPQRAFLADGKDAAIVEAFLIGDIEAYPQDINLNIYDSSHGLRPTPLKIPAGQAIGQAALTSASAGPVSVEFLGSSPGVVYQGSKALNISFVPPITRMRIEMSPPSFSLMDTADVLVAFTDEQGRNISPASKRTVSLLLQSGRGHLTDQQLTLSPGQVEARTTFIPNSPGAVTVEAHSDNLANAAVQLHVETPFVLLLCSAVGGAVGGFLTRRTRRKTDKYRVPVGVVTGLIFYWACLFLGITVIGRAFVLNPVSAGVLSAIGGWLQTKVFDVVWGAARTTPHKA